jgi:hypothetical protein
MAEFTNEQQERINELRSKKYSKTDLAIMIVRLEAEQPSNKLVPVPYNPPQNAITTLEQANDYIDKLERKNYSYQANVDALIRIYKAEGRLNVIKKPDEKLEPYYSSSQWTEMVTWINEIKTVALVDYAVNYLQPYSESAAKLEKVTQEIMDNIFKLTTTELANIIPGAAGELTKCLANLIERQQAAYLTNDIQPVIDDVNDNATLLVNFVKNPTKENHKRLKDKFDRWKTVPIKRLLDYRSGLPKVGRKSGADAKRVIIWEYAEPYYNKLGAENAGEKAIKELEQFIEDKQKRLSNDEIEQIFPDHWQALQTQKYTIKDGIKSERKRVPDSLASYMRQLAYDVNNGKI